MSIDKDIENAISEFGRLHEELKEVTIRMDKLIAEKKKEIDERMEALNIVNENMDATESTIKWRVNNEKDI